MKRARGTVFGAFGLIAAAACADLSGLAGGRDGGGVTPPADAAAPPPDVVVPVVDSGPDVVVEPGCPGRGSARFCAGKTMAGFCHDFDDTNSSFAPFAATKTSARGSLSLVCSTTGAPHALRASCAASTDACEAFGTASITPASKTMQLDLQLQLAIPQTVVGVPVIVTRFDIGDPRGKIDALTVSIAREKQGADALLVTTTISSKGTVVDTRSAGSVVNAQWARLQIDVGADKIKFAINGVTTLELAVDDREAIAPKLAVGVVSYAGGSAVSVDVDSVTFSTQ